ncbi:hypothetical protein FVEN_g4669 [Fusarium venenatum]|nr:hypothetical protein FVEN_g4669 [Fusarium venenatum]
MSKDRDRNLDTSHHYNELTNPLDSGLCIIKWLQIWALSTGAVRATSWDELQQHIAASPSIAVEWTLFDLDYHSTCPPSSSFTSTPFSFCHELSIALR